MPSQPDESAALAIQTPAINDRSLAAGLAYAMGSRVTGISFDAGTGLMLGKVRGSADTPYSTTAKLVRKGGGWSCTVGVCSCPVRKDCKHVAALLFAAEDNPATRVQLLAPSTSTQVSHQPGRGRPVRLGAGPQPADCQAWNGSCRQRGAAGAAVRG